jgi:hypothetical protein
MKKIGIVGGVGWRLTVDSYTQLCERSERRWLAMRLHGVPSFPHMCIESLDLAQAVAYLGRDADDESRLRRRRRTRDEPRSWPPGGDEDPRSLLADTGTRCARSNHLRE